jgi:hypothetical protein
MPSSVQNELFSKKLKQKGADLRFAAACFLASPAPLILFFQPGGVSFIYTDIY